MFHHKFFCLFDCNHKTVFNKRTLSRTFRHFNLNFSLQNCAGSDPHQCGYADWGPHWQRSLWRHWSKEMAIRRVEWWRHTCKSATSSWRMKWRGCRPETTAGKWELHFYTSWNTESYWIKIHAVVQTNADDSIGWAYIYGVGLIELPADDVISTCSTADRSQQSTR